jgi:hypothetical protein
VPPASLAAQTVTRSVIVRAEDARGKGPEGIEPILAGLRNPALRETAIRAIGRLERPDLMVHIVQYMEHRSLRATLADALAQLTRGVPAPDQRTSSDSAIVDAVYNVLRGQAMHESDGPTKGALARSMGRLPYSEARQARAADSMLVTLAPLRIEQRDAFPAMAGVAQGLYTLARARRTLGALSPRAVDWLRQAAFFGFDVPEAGSIRRPAWLALNANGTVDRRDVSGAISRTPIRR